jgi:uncharacterized protein YqeY
MSVIEKLKVESLRLRKERNPFAAAITFTLSEIDKVGKNAGNRPTTEDEAIKVVQKLVVMIDENMKYVTKEDDKTAFIFEKQILQSVLPQMASDEEVRNYLTSSFTEKPANKGVVMKVLKEKFGALVDMKRAGQIATEMYGI